MNVLDQKKRLRDQVIKFDVEDFCVEDFDVVEFDVVEFDVEDFDGDIIDDVIIYEAGDNNPADYDLWKKVNNFKMSSVYRNELSFNRCKIDVLKSGLQKYIRRNILDKAMWCAIELDIFAYCPYYKGENHTTNYTNDESVLTKSESIRTNLLNRLRVIYLEDIGLANVQVLDILDKWFVELFEYQDRRKNMTFVLQTWLDIREKEMCLILNIVDMLCKSKKSRSFSHYKAVFMNSIESHQKKIIDENPNLFSGLENTKYTFPIKYQLSGEEEKYRKLINNFIEALYLKNDIVFYWANQILLSFKPTQKRNGSLKTEIFIFDVLLWFIKKHFNGDVCNILTKNVKILLSWFKNPRLKFKEISLTLVYAIMLLLKYEVIDLATNNVKYETKYANFEKVYNTNLSGTIIEFDSYVIDVHTQKGRNNKKTKVDFAQEGAFVENEDKILVSQLYKQIYLETKKWDIPNKVKIMKDTTTFKDTTTMKDTTTITSTKNSVKPNVNVLITKYTTAQNTQCSASVTDSSNDNPKLPEIVYDQQYITPIILKAILKWPTAQKQTASWKKKTYMGHNYVAKGPYDIRKIGEKGRLLRVNRRQLCNIGTDTPNLPYFFVREQNCLSNVWIISKQLAMNEPKLWKSNDRDSCGVYRVINLNPKTWENNERLVVLLFKNVLLNIVTMQGDSGMHNQLTISHNKLNVLVDKSLDLKNVQIDISVNKSVDVSNVISKNDVVSLVQIDTEDLRMSQPLSTTNDWKELMFIKNPKKEVMVAIEKAIVKFNIKIIDELKLMMISIHKNANLWGLTKNGLLCGKRFIELIAELPEINMR